MNLFENHNHMLFMNQISQKVELKDVIYNYLEKNPIYLEQFNSLSHEDALIFRYFSLKKEKQEQQPKRVEEKQKMFFKKAFKFIENQYFSSKNNKKKIQKRFKHYDDFYNHYFAEVARKNNIEIKNYYHPQKSGNKNSPTINKSGQRSFNQMYINLILESSQFLQETSNYLQNNFLEECLSERTTKTEKFLNKCQLKIQEIKQTKYHSCDEENLKIQKEMIHSMLQGYVLENNKCKIPWGMTELEETQLFALRYIENIMGSQNYNQNLLIKN